MARANAGFHRDSVTVRARCRNQAERAKPLWLLEKIAMQGASGVEWYQPSQASRARGGMVSSSHCASWKYTISA